MFESVDWYAVFTPETPLLETFVRGTCIYLGLFVLLRVILKRESSTLSITDLLLVVLVAEAAQNGMADDYRSIPDGLLLVATVIFWSYALNWLGFHFPFFQRLLKSDKLPLIKNGQMLKDNMRKELITVGELKSEMRLSGIEDMTKVKAAYIEPNGTISFIGFEEKQEGKKEEKPVV